MRKLLEFTVAVVFGIFFGFIIGVVIRNTVEKFNSDSIILQPPTVLPQSSACSPNDCVSRPRPTVAETPPQPPVTDTIVSPTVAPPDQFSCYDPDVVNGSEYFDNTTVFIGIGDCWASINYNVTAVFRGDSDTNLVCIPKEGEHNEFYCLRIQSQN